MKKISLFLIVAMIISIIPNFAFADTVYAINTPEDFKVYMTGVENGTINTGASLANDIDVSEVYEVFTPISTEYNFEFDGNGNEIKGINIVSDDISAIFKVVGSSGVIKNLTVSGSVTGDYAAAIAGTNNGTISNVINKAEIIAEKSASGIAYINGGIIQNCENLGNINALLGGEAAGIVNKNEKDLVNCINYGTVNGVDNNVHSNYVAGIAVKSTGNGTFENNTNVGSVTGGEKCAGIVSEYQASTPLNGCINAGKISGSTMASGIVSYSYGTNVSACVNYGEVTATDEYASGISSDATNISECKNYGTVKGLDKVGGIASQASGMVENCDNYGQVNGSSKVAGIIANSYGGTVFGCTNYGEINGQESQIGGIVGSGENLNVEKCANLGNVSGGLSGNSASNFAAGIAAFLTNGGETYAKDLYSVGNVVGKNVTSALVGYIDFDLQGGFKYINGNNAIHTSYDDYGKNVYAYHEWGYETEHTDKFSTGELAWMLNTYEGTVENRGVWSQGELYPVLADEHHKPVKKFIYKDDNYEEVLYTGANGYVPEFPISVTCEFYDENGAIVSANDVFGTIEDKSATAYVYNEEEMKAAAADEDITKIILVNGVSLSESLNISGEKELVGNNNRITFTEGGIVSSNKLVLNDISICSQEPVTIDGGQLEIQGFVEIQNPIVVNSGEINVNEGTILNVSASTGSPDFIVADGVLVYADKYTAKDGTYTYNDISTNSIAWDIAALAEKNESLEYDVYATFKTKNVYMFLPCTANIGNITLSVLNKNGEFIEDIESVDFSDNKTITTVVRGSEYTVTAMQSELPTLSFLINEEWGTIDAMNSCPDHDTKCFGDVRLDIKPELENEETGWVSFVSQENDEKKKGTMEIKGRGNSTWSIEPGVKKPYQFKVEKKTDVLGMGKHKTWIILKNDEDIVRNKLGLDLGEMIGLEYSGKSEFVDVFMNGQYLGNYLLCEKVEIDDTRVNISNLDDEYEDNNESIEGLDMTGGYLLEIDNWGGDELQILHESSNTVMSVKAPEDLAKKVTADNEYGYIWNYMTDWLDAVYGNGIMPDGQSYLDYIDVESFVRYFFHQEFLRNGDCGRGSTYMYKDKDSIDPLIYAGPIWDNDRIYEKTNNVEGWLLSTINYAETGTPTLYNALNRREDFAKLLVWYYENSDIREVLESASSLIDVYVETLGVSPEMNRIRWDYDSEFDISWLKDTMEQRFAWVDANYKTLTDIAIPELVNIDRTADDNTLKFNVYNNTDEQLDCEVYVAQYSGNKLISVEVCDDVKLAVGGRSEDYEYKLSNGCDKVNVMVWKGVKPVNKNITLIK